MKFERSNIVDGLCDNLKQWEGWSGYLTNRLLSLKAVVEGELEEMSKVDNVNTVSAFPFNSVSGDWQFFYPVEPPKKKGKLVPFDDSQELVKSYWGITPKNSRPLIWVKHKGVGLDVLISGYNRGFVCVENKWIRMKELFNEYTFLDGTPIGKEK